MPSDDIIESLRAALAADPGNPELVRHLARTMLHLGRADEAVATLREGLRHRPENTALKCMLGRAFRAAGKFSAAHVVLDDVIAGDSDVAQARVERARTLFAEGKVDECVREYRKAIDEDPDAGDAEFAAKLGLGGPAADAEVELGEVHEGRVVHDGDGGSRQFEPFKPDTSFAKVGGMEAVKDDIRRKIIQPLQHPELYAAYGKKAGGGILLYGPPGCGKTHLARAVAGEIEASFLPVGIHDVLDMYIGNSERNLRGIFETARAHRPCVLFFDEADALGASRTDMRQSAGRHTINQLLSEMDGVEGRNEGLLVLGATNAPWQMDAAFRRPGRFDRVVFVPPPDRPARAEILRIHCGGKPQQEIDFDAVARKTDGFSGADLQAVVDESVERKLDDAVRSGKPEPLTTKDLLRAAKQRKPTTREWFRSARNHVLYANEDGLYDDIKPYL